jgi:hypothetical protein
MMSISTTGGAQRTARFPLTTERYFIDSDLSKGFVENQLPALGALYDFGTQLINVHRMRET